MDCQARDIFSPQFRTFMLVGLGVGWFGGNSSPFDVKNELVTTAAGRLIEYRPATNLLIGVGVIRGFRLASCVRDRCAPGHHHHPAWNDNGTHHDWVPPVRVL